MVDSYTVDSVDRLVTGGSDDVDEVLDLFRAFVELPLDQMIYLTERFEGASAVEAMAAAGVDGNSTRYHKAAVMALARILNGVHSAST